MANAQQAANKINNATQFKTDPTTTIAEAAIELKQAETQVKASAQVITMANERITSLFDDFA
ncbi:MAG: hypothetical protein GXP14_11485 [Gammaproteobacteria bacterium]|nr:hypothetical protein [Gammaproteobacteria bacterium]